MWGMPNRRCRSSRRTCDVSSQEILTTSSTSSGVETSAMSNPSDRINHPIPDAELDRRWTAIRSAMGAAGLDVLLAQASNDFMGGYVKYLTDIPATNGYVTTVVFPRDEPMIVVGQGAFGTDLHFPDGDLVRRGVGRFLGTPSYASAHYSAGYDAELAASAMGRYAHGSVGMLGTTAISLAL